MLFLLKKKNFVSKLYIGDKLNLIYRFKGVFFVMMGTCVFNRKKDLCLYSKRKNNFIFFNILFLNIRDIYKFETFSYNSIFWKRFYRSVFILN